jgi:hypothetical protein
VQTISLPRGTHKRLDCPVCGGRNTFSITNDGGLKWHCFRASCACSGTAETELSLDEILHPMKIEPIRTLDLSTCINWDRNLKQHPEAIEYLQKNNCWEAYAKYPNKVFFDKVKQRVVFVEYETINTVKLATGRSLTGDEPKWYKYIALPGAYYVAKPIAATKYTHACVVVEDCASAASVSRLANGLALCGTSWNTFALVTALTYLGIKDVIVCLDPDAATKGMKLRLSLEGLGRFRSVRVANTLDDLKYAADLKEIEGILDGRTA